MVDANLIFVSPIRGRLLRKGEEYGKGFGDCSGL